MPLGFERSFLFASELVLRSESLGKYVAKSLWSGGSDLRRRSRLLESRQASPYPFMIEQFERFRLIFQQFDQLRRSAAKCGRCVGDFEVIGYQGVDCFGDDCGEVFVFGVD